MKLHNFGKLNVWAISVILLRYVCLILPYLFMEQLTHLLWHSNFEYIWNYNLALLWMLLINIKIYGMGWEIIITISIIIYLLFVLLNK